MRKYLSILPLLWAFCAFSQSRWVDPMVGTGGTGHTFPAATVPFGMVQVGPDTRIDGSWEGCSGYRHSDSVIYGFSHTHLSGTGCSDYGDIMLMPYVGKPAAGDPHFYRSPFSHASEKAEPGYYTVVLDRGGIRCEMAATPRAAIHRYSLPGSARKDTLRIVMDLTHRDRLLDWRMDIAPNAVSGYRRSRAWAQDQTVYYYWEADKPIVAVTRADTAGSCRVFSFVLEPGEALTLKVGISGVDGTGARRNVSAEIPGFDLQAVKEKARASWDKELSRIEITGGTDQERTNFYTALYHTMIHPSLFSDTDGRYRGRDGRIHRTKTACYTVFSLWDTFRALHPLHALIHREKTEDFVRTFLLQYRQGGRLPMWELWCNETDCMIGYHAVSVLADAAAKGIPMDLKRALRASVASANYNDRGIPLYARKHYLETGDEHESVAKTLEYAYDDWCLALLARAAGKPQVAERYLARSGAWMNLLDPETGLMRPRQNGGWLTPFDPREVNNHYTEANAWQYSFFVPQDVYGLITATGGAARFEALLDGLFTAPSATTGREQADITGLVWQYAHGNEPSHHIAYLYDYIGRPEKTAARVHRILTELYRPVPDGLPGNEDAGQMSAWYVFGALGFYPVTPGSNRYAIGFPLFASAAVRLENGRTFTVKASGNTEGSYFLQKVVLDGRPLNRLWITHDEIRQGGTLELAYGPQPSAGFDASGAEPFPSEFPSPAFLPAPSIVSPAGPFKERAEVRIVPFDERHAVWYTVDGSDPRTNGKTYTGPFPVTEKCTVRAVTHSTEGAFGAEAVAYFTPFPHPERHVTLGAAYTPQYDAGGTDGLIDGIRGDVNWRKGHWQGYQGTDFFAEVDLGRTQTVVRTEIGFLQDARSWILLPTGVRVEWLDENRQVLETAGKSLPGRDTEEGTFLFPAAWDIRTEGVRYVRVHAANYGALPAWHPGAGSPAFIFVDEIIVE